MAERKIKIHEVMGALLTIEGWIFQCGGGSKAGYAKHQLGRAKVSILALAKTIQDDERGNSDV